MCQPVQIQIAPSLPEFGPDAGVLDVQPLLGHTVMYVHSGKTQRTSDLKNCWSMPIFAVDEDELRQ